jgi:hypothetical protein
MGKILDAIRNFLRDFFVGAAYLEFEQTLRAEKLARHDLFLLLMYGNLLGLPVLPPYYSLRILPHVLPGIDSWKKRLLRERDLTELKGL